MKNIYAYIECFIKRIFSIKKRIGNYCINTISGIEGDKDALEMELHRVRYYYNLCDKLSSGFVLGFISGFVVLMVGCAKSTVTEYDASGLKDVPYFIVCFFLIILICQVALVVMAYTYYEKMKVVKAELKKINDTVQPNPKK